MNLVLSLLFLFAVSVSAEYYQAVAVVDLNSNENGKLYLIIKSDKSSEELKLELLPESDEEEGFISNTRFVKDFDLGLPVNQVNELRFLWEGNDDSSEGPVIKLKSVYFNAKDKDATIHFEKSDVYVSNPKEIHLNQEVTLKRAF